MWVSSCLLPCSGSRGSLHLVSRFIGRNCWLPLQDQCRFTGLPAVMWIRGNSETTGSGRISRALPEISPGKHPVCVIPPPPLACRSNLAFREVLAVDSCDGDGSCYSFNSFRILISYSGEEPLSEQ